MGTLREWIISIASIMIFAVMVQMTVPSGTIKKLITLVLGLITIMVVIKPMTKFVEPGFLIEDSYLSGKSFLDKAELENRGENLEERQAAQIIEVYRSKVSDRVKGIISLIEEVEFKSVQLILNEDISSEEFGVIKQLFIYVTKKENEGKTGSIRIDKIEASSGIERTDKDAQKNSAEDELSVALINKIKEKVSGILEIDKDNITVSIRGAEDEY